MVIKNDLSKFFGKAAVGKEEKVSGNFSGNLDKAVADAPNPSLSETPQKSDVLGKNENFFNKTYTNLRF